MNRKHSTVTSIRQLVPFAFVGFLIGGGIAGVLHPWLAALYALGIAAYLILALLSGFGQSRNPIEALRVAFGCFIMHLSYGLGYWPGVFHFLLLQRNPSARQAAVTR